MKVRISYTVDVDKHERVVLGDPANEKLATRKQIQRFYKRYGTHWRAYLPIAEYEKEGD
jgi:ABC-type transporter MlaC component